MILAMLMPYAPSSHRVLLLSLLDKHQIEKVVEKRLLNSMCFEHAMGRFQT